MTEYKINIHIGEFPPEEIYSKCVKKWGVDFKDGVVFTYGTDIYSQYPLPDDLIVHEKTHVRQQLEMGKEKWWKKYFEDDKFRFNEELEAYRNQYKYFQNNIKDKNRLSESLQSLSGFLCGSMYGNLASFSEARKLIKK